MSRAEKLQALLEKEPHDAFLNYGLAIEWAKQDRMADAVAQFEKTLQLDPNYIAAHFHKAKTLLAMGDEPAARAELKRGIDRAQACGEMHAMGEMQEMLASLGS